MRIYLLLFFFQTTLIYKGSTQSLQPTQYPLTESGQVFSRPFAGGMNLPQFSMVDLNNDGKKDIVVYDRDGQTVSPFLNQGNPGQTNYQYAPQFIDRFPKKIVNYMLMRDYNCDGLEDIFMHYQRVGQGAGMAVLEASYDANDTIVFTMVKDVLLYSSASPFPGTIFVFNTDVPAIDDIDNDGDLDILCFTLSFTFAKNVFFYRNTSVENGYGCDSLDFVLENECFGQFEESGFQSICQFSPSIDSCRNNNYWKPIVGNKTLGNSIPFDRSPRHIGATISAVDINGDNIKDLALGGVSYRNLNAVYATEVNDTLLMISQDTFYPSYDLPVDIFSFPSSYFIDVNNDGRLDMIAAPTETGFCEAVKDSVAWLYQNQSLGSGLQLQFSKKNFLCGDMLDLGENAFPVLVDMDRDGLTDILVGTTGRCQDNGNVVGLYQDGLAWLRNTGSLSNPSFELITRNFAATDTINKTMLHPTCGDLDGDGDQDIILGCGDGTLLYLQNTTTGVGAPTFNTVQYNYEGIDVGNESSPHLADLDRDGDLDLIIGNYAGKTFYFENTGTSTTPSFSSTATLQNIGGYDMSIGYGRNINPFFVDIDSAWHCFLGQQNGDISHLGNIDGNVTGIYDTLSTQFAQLHLGRNSDLAVGDLDNDGLLDYVFGNIRGGLSIYEEVDIMSSHTTIETNADLSFKIYPNPSNDFLHLSSEADFPHDLRLTIRDVLGQIHIEKMINSPMDHSIIVKKLQNGLYFVTLQHNDLQQTIPFVKQ